MSPHQAIVRWVDKHPLLTNVILIVLIAGPGYFRLEGIVNQACEDRRNGRIILRELVELSDDGTGLSLTGFDSFDDLDPETQQYLRDLEAASREAPRPSEFVRSALTLLDIPEC
jgi:hypothetical protein